MGAFSGLQKSDCVDFLICAPPACEVSPEHSRGCRPRMVPRADRDMLVIRTAGHMHLNTDKTLISEICIWCSHTHPWQSLKMSDWDLDIKASWWVERKTIFPVNNIQHSQWSAAGSGFLRMEEIMCVPEGPHDNQPGSPFTLLVWRKMGEPFDENPIFLKKKKLIQYPWHGEER